MAKSSKKPESKQTSKPRAPAKKPAAKAPAPAAASNAAPKKPAGKSEPKARPNLLGGGSLIDTSLVASAAANLLLAKRKGRDQIDDPISIDQIKSDLSKPAAAVAGELLDQHAESAGA